MYSNNSRSRKHAVMQAHAYACTCSCKHTLMQAHVHANTRFMCKYSHATTETYTLVAHHYSSVSTHVAINVEVLTRKHIARRYSCVGIHAAIHV